MKKLLSIALVLAMLFTLSTPALATSGPDIKAVMNGNGAKATLTVLVNGVESEPLVWSNNNTTVVELGGYAVSVAIKSNKVNNVTWEPIVIAGPLSGADETGAAVIFDDPDIGGGGKTNGVEEETELPKVIVPANNAIFHCNANGGNGRVWVDKWTADWNTAVAEAAAQGLKKAAVGLEFTQASDDAKRWILNTTEYVCPSCGRTDWISFSNKSGLPNGKNMQLQHLALDPPIFEQGFDISKTVNDTLISEWAYSNADVTYDELCEQITFYVYRVSGDKEVIPLNAVPVAEGHLAALSNSTLDFGSWLPTAGWYAITEEYLADSWAAKNFKTPKIQYFYIDEKGLSKGNVDWTDPDDVAVFKQMHAIAANDAVADANKVAEALKGSGNPNVDQRANAKNAFGTPDAIQGMQNGDERFTGLGFFPEGVTYYFGNGDKTYDIYNNPNPAVADLSLIEVTWGEKWHTEAVDIYLVDAMIDGVLQQGDYFIGTAYNRKNPVGIGPNGFDYKARVVGNFTYTDIYLPTQISKAAAIRLVDKTAEINTPPTYNTYKSFDDGYDLDALVAYYTQPSDTFVNKLLTPSAN